LTRLVINAHTTRVHSSRRLPFAHNSARIRIASQADIKQFIGLPGVHARYEILRSCVEELMRAKVVVVGDGDLAQKRIGANDDGDGDGDGDGGGGVSSSSPCVLPYAALRAGPAAAAAAASSSAARAPTLDVAFAVALRDVARECRGFSGVASARALVVVAVII
jgi:hypothetical protein